MTNCLLDFYDFNKIACYLVYSLCLHGLAGMLVDQIVKLLLGSLIIFIIVEITVKLVPNIEFSTISSI